jgi:hypothetical protein
MKIRSLFLFVTLLCLTALGISKISHPAPLSACTWVTTSCGSGCADNKDLYNCSNNVQIKSVSASNSNQDSNKKAQSVAPPTVTQYIPPVDNNASGVVHKVDQNTKKAEDYITSGQKINPDVKTTDQTGMGGSVKESVGQTATVVEGVNPAQPGQGGGGSVTGLPTNLDCSDTSREFCGGVSNLYRCVPIYVQGQCNMRCGRTVDAQCAQQYGKPELAGKEVGYVYIQGACSKPENKASCGADQLQLRCSNGGTACASRVQFRNAELGTNSSSSVQVTGITGINGSINLPLDNFQDKNGNKMFENVNGQSYIKSDWGDGVYAMGESKGNTITSGGEGSACTPGTTQTYYDSVGGKVTSTQRGGDRGACGQLGCPAGQQRLCNANGLGTCTRTDACAYQIQTVTEGQSCSGLQRLSNGEPGNGQFVGCYQGKNCFCGQAGSASSSVKCYADAGADSCGAAGGLPEQQSISSPPPSQPPSSNPPASSPPKTPPPSSPQPGQCVQITKNVQVPELGDQVSFTCAPVNLATRYEFRYAYTTANTVSENQYQPLQPTSATANTSQPITVDKVGRYVAMCRPCFGNNQCETWQVATLQEQD